MTRQNKLDEIRDELANNYDSAYPALNHCNFAFSDGWDAAMERVNPLVEALQSISAHHMPLNIPVRWNSEEKLSVILNDTKIARGALEKFRGEE